MESSKKLIILLVVGVIVAFTAIAVRNRMASQPPVPEAASHRVLIANRDLAPGTIIQGSGDIGWGAPPEKTEGEAPNENLLHEGKINPADFGGAVVRRQLRAGDYIEHSMLTRAGEGGFMSAVLEPGMRAVSIAVNATSGNAGFIAPGDRVDLIVTHRIKNLSADKESGGGESVVSETFVRNVRVLAVDQMLDNPENKAVLAKTVTVEVTPRQAEQISVAAEMGRISMALRSLLAQPKPAEGEENPVVNLYGEPENYTRDSDISRLLHRKDNLPPVRVIRGDQSESIEFY